MTHPSSEELDRLWDEVAAAPVTDADDPRFGRVCPGRCGTYLGTMEYARPRPVVEWRGDWWHKECARHAAVWEQLGKARVRLWFCPDADSHGYDPTLPQVEWRGDVAHCLRPGCGKTSEVKP